jgi:Fe-S cluster assembly ATP-binding protein
MVVTGPNGGGKSTLAKLIMGIEKPTGGRILFNGEDITEKNVTERALAGIGYAFQQPPRFKGVTVRKLLDIASGRDLSNEESCDYLTGVGLCARDYFEREVDASLSGGELKRVEIATLMARSPMLAIYDEPEAGIDLWSFSMLAESFGNFDRSKGQSIIIISHQERIISLADDIMIMAGGRVKAFGPRSEIMPSLQHSENKACPCPSKKEYIKFDNGSGNI